MHEHIGVVGSQSLELVGGAAEGQFRDFGNVFCKQVSEFRLRIEPGADRCATLRQRVKISCRHSQPCDAALDLGCVAGKFLTERQRRRVLGMGPADLDDVRECLFLFAQRAVKLAQRRNEIADDRHRCRDVHGGRE